MPEPLYDDDKCTYCGGDPRLEHRLVKGTLILTEEAVKFEGEEDSVVWPRSRIKEIKYAPTAPMDVDMEAIIRTHGIDAAQDIDIALAMDPPVPPEPALSFRVDDPEHVKPEGFDIRVVFRDEYYAKVFAKRTEKALGVHFVSDE